MTCMTLWASRSMTATVWFSSSATNRRLRARSTAKWSMRPRTSPSGIFLSSRKSVSSAQPGETRSMLVSASAAVNDFMAIVSSFSISLFCDYRQAIEGCDRVGFGPKADAAAGEPAVAVIDEWPAVEPATEAVAVGRHAQRVPLAQHRRHNRRARKHVAAPVVVVEPEIVLGGVRAHEIVAAFRETKDDAAGCILPAGDRFESHGDVDVAVGAARSDDDVKFVVRGALYQRAPIAGGAGHVLDAPCAGDGFPPVQQLGEIEPPVRPGRPREATSRRRA